MSPIGPFTIPILAVGAFAATLGWFGYQHVTRGSSASKPAAVATDARHDAALPAPHASAAAKPEAGSRPFQEAVARPEAAAERSAAAERAGGAREASPGKPSAPAAAAPAPSAAPPPASPAFDVVRVEPTGETVVAGRAAPGATVELLLNGARHSRVVADPSGLFALVPEALPPGGHELVLQVTNGDGTKVRSPQSVTVVVAANRKDAPLVTITAPGQPAVVLSRPGGGTNVASARADPAPEPKPGALPAGPESKPASGAGAGSPPAAAPAPSVAAKARPPVQIASVETEGTGRFLVSASAAPAAVVRLYLNETFIAPASAGADGRVSFAIERGMQPGSYKVRVDDIDPVSGQVRSRAEVPFEMPYQVASRAIAPSQSPMPAAGPVEEGAKVDATPSRYAVAGEPTKATESSAKRDVEPRKAVTDLSPTVVVPEINTAIVSRGDSLWAISKRAYGEGLRYTVIYGANARQIRDPDLIYPGQLFVLPVPGQERAAR